MEEFVQSQAQTFFIDALSVYKKIVDANHMHHQELYSTLALFLKRSVSGDTSLLDLGCGDASMIKAVLLDTGITRYRGLDLSEVALGHARKNLEPLRIKVDLACTDMLAYLKKAPTDQFDIIFSGYALHHLDDTGKADFVSAAINHLKPGGILLIADVFRDEDEALEAYLDRFCKEIRMHWSCLSSNEVEHTEDHVRGFDQPATLNQLKQLAMHRDLPFERIFKQSFYQMIAIGPSGNLNS